MRDLIEIELFSTVICLAMIHRYNNFKTSKVIEQSNTGGRIRVQEEGTKDLTLGNLPHSYPSILFKSSFICSMEEKD